MQKRTKRLKLHQTWRKLSISIVFKDAPNEELKSPLKRLGIDIVRRY
jgi:hypothetical protein